MLDMNKIIREFETQINEFSPACTSDELLLETMTAALLLLKEQDKEIKALRLLVEWAIECDFGLDQIRDEYLKYKSETKDMGYIDCMIHVAKRTLEDHGAFE